MSIKEAKEIIYKIAPGFQADYEKNGVEFYAAIMGSVKRESDFTANAVNKEKNKEDWRDDSSGYMQVRIATARQVWAWWSMIFKSDKWIYDKLMNDKEFNITTGAKYLTWQLKRYKWDLAKAYAAYNAGSVIYTKTGPVQFINQAYSDYCVRQYKIYYKECQ